MAILKLIDFKEIGLEYYDNNFFTTGYDYDLMKTIDCDVPNNLGLYSYKLIHTNIPSLLYRTYELNNKYWLKTSETNNISKKLPYCLIVPNLHDKNGVIYLGFRFLYQLNTSGTFLNVKFFNGLGAQILTNKSYVVGQEVYHEIELNYNDDKIRFYDDNVMVNEVTIPSFNHNAYFGFAGTVAVGESMLTDVYVVHDKAGDPNPTGRLGPISIENVTVSQFINPSNELSVHSDTYYTMNNETNPVNVVNYRLGWGETINSGVVLGNDNPALEARVSSIDVDNLSNGTIKAVQVTSYTNKDSSSESEVTTRIKVSNNELASSKSIPKELNLDKYYTNENGRIILTDFGQSGAINKNNLKLLQIFNEAKKQT